MKGKQCSKEEIEKDYLSVKEKLKHYPSRSEYEKNGKFSIKPFVTKYGSWNNFTLHMGGEIQTGGGKKLAEPDFDIVKYDDYQRVNSNSCIILNDPHIPYHSIKLIKEMIKVSTRLDIDTLIIGGDFLDFKGLYHKEVQQTRIDWIDEIKEAVKVINYIIDYYKKIYIISGNHDHRLNRFLGASDKAERLMSLLFNHPKIKYSKYQYCILNNTWDIIHEGNTKVKLSKLERLINVNRRSAIVGHSHRWAMGIADSGIEVICEGLHATDPLLHEYAQIKRGDYSKWISGFWIMKNNKIIPYVKHAGIYNPFLEGMP